MASTTQGTINTPPTTTAGTEEASAPVPKLVFDLSEKALVKALDSITPENILEFTTLLEVVQTSAIDISIFALFEFQGFDPVAIIRKLLVVNHHYRITLGKAEETLEVLKEDVMMMIAANIFMGNLQQKSLQRRSAAGRLKISQLIAKYAIKKGSTGTGLASDQITFPRVSNALPVLATRMASVLPSKDFLAGPFVTKELPKFMRISAFASFCDPDLEERTRLFLLHAVCSYSCDQSIIVFEGEKKKKKDKKDETVMTPLDAYALQWDFISVASTSTVPKKQMRKSMLVEFQVESLYSRLEPIVKNFRTLIGDSTVMVTKAEYEKDIRDFCSSTT